MINLAARPAPLDLEVDRSAVIVVDMQNAFASKGGMFDLAGHDISGAPRAVAVTRQVLAAARRAGMAVIYLQMSFRPDLSDAGGPDSPNFHKELALRMMRERPELKGKLLTDGTWDWQIVDALAPEAGDKVVRKSRYSGFTNTDLEAHLKARGIRTLFFTGIATNVCVESTARHALFAEFFPVLIEDAVNHAGPDFTRQATLWNFENVLGWVTSSDRLLSALHQGQADAQDPPVGLSDRPFARTD